MHLRKYLVAASSNTTPQVAVTPTFPAMQRVGRNATIGVGLRCSMLMLCVLSFEFAESRLSTMSFHPTCGVGLRRPPQQHRALERSFGQVPRMKRSGRGHSSALAMVTYAEALLVAPQATKAATAALLGGLGDLLAQVAEKKGKPLSIDRRRSTAMTFFAVSYTGIFQAWWIKRLGELVQLKIPVVEAATKTLLCQFGTIPLVYMPMFFLMTGALRGETIEEIADRAKQDFFRIYLRNVSFWIPVQMVQFFYIAPSWQIPFLSVMGLLWNSILSFIGLRAPPQAASNPSWELASSEVDDSSPVGTEDSSSAGSDHAISA